MKKVTSKRIWAFIIDYIIVLIISSFIGGISFLNPKIKEYDEVYNRYLDFASDLTTDDVSRVFNDEELTNITYDLSKAGTPVTIINLVVSFLYFVVLQVITKGQTVGKRLLKIKVISTKDDKLGFFQMFFRSGIINSIFTSLTALILLLSLSKSSFYQMNQVVQLIDMSLIFISIGMMIFRNDGCGLHDLLTNTNVVSISDIKSDIKEAKVIKKQSKEK